MSKIYSSTITKGRVAMLKGINHQVIEITDTGNIYYEKALLIVNPQFSTANTALLDKEAKKFLKNMSAPSSIKKSKNKLSFIIKFGLAMSLGSLITSIIFYIA